MVLRNIDLPKYGTYLFESKHKDKDVVHEHHHPIHQILYIIEGQGHIIIDGISHSVTQDNTMIIAPFSKHSIISNSSLTMLVLAFDKKSLDTTIQLDLINAFFQISSSLKPNSIVSSELRQLLRKMLFEQSNNSIIKSSALKIYLLQLLLIIARSQEFTQYIDTNSIRAERIKQVIETQYYEPLTLSIISSRMGLSSRYLNAIFKEQYHLTPMQYLSDVRVQHAQKLLVESDKEIVTICFEVGYETLSTFYRVFKKSLNMSPNQYRQTHKYPN
ncbi:helix-turn-helix domain-containing protein [Halalkalibacter akibai]|uniref:Transcriptional regulator n=1 Tax=Halalkalibacter akibai (strain ATCC 43226 / DSM 21942 / CIP 109018 / JCM 9157 / 1139) TaxID=1236973 RepID=W4QV64_HALA3|nr:AraC family transcriptional regulator [Halalkalibacter akibai]GAE35229.1 transcriptional regulator [Halalkalibacter akibai JCM 9157]